MILTRDSDFGPQFEKHVLLNDHLKQEFKERVSKKRNVLVYKTASQALQHFDVAVRESIVKGELEFIAHSPPSVAPTTSARPTADRLREFLQEFAVVDNDIQIDEDFIDWDDIDEPDIDEPDIDEPDIDEPEDPGES